MEIKQGDIYWVDFGYPGGSAPGFLHPYVIIQNDLFNRSKINTVIALALTSNLTRASVPGNVLLKKGEGNLPKSSVVDVSQIMTIDKTDLGEKVGHLSGIRIGEILEGLRLITEPRNV